MAVLFTGGARSGKSRFAEAYAASLGNEGIYIATSQLGDDEMRVRAERHRQRRGESGFSWRTVEEPYQLNKLLAEADGSIMLIDCLTLWLTNWLLKYESEDDPEAMVTAKVEELAELMSRLPGHVLAVTNEVGSGIVPEYPLGRQFRDLAGFMNRRIAAVCDKVFLVTAGIPIELKSLSYRFPGEDGWAR